jgi:hypothetical protein
MADLAEHLVKVAGRWPDASLGDKPLDARWQRGGVRGITTHKHKVIAHVTRLSEELEGGYR